MFTPDPLKTRSGKIMRRLLRDVASGRSSATPRRWPMRAWWSRFVRLRLGKDDE
ncbi:MAG: hypothetical protein U0841_30285 [Chloroflexia bacterium]